MVTMNIWPKFNKTFNSSQSHNWQSLVWIYRPVQEIGADKHFWGSKFNILLSPVTLKKGQGHQNLITCFPCHDVSMWVWSESIHWFTRQKADMLCRKGPYQKQYAPSHSGLEDIFFNTVIPILMLFYIFLLPVTVAWLAEFDLHVRHLFSWRLGHEKISTAILPLPLIQEEQL